MNENKMICECVNQLEKIIGKKDRAFYSQILINKLCQIISIMHIRVNLPGRGLIPINAYTWAMANSGYGKGLVTNTIERDITNPALAKYQAIVRSPLAEQNINKLVVSIQDKQLEATGRCQDADKILGKIELDYRNTGSYLPHFDNATGPAIKQLRLGILIGGSGSFNLQMDEVGTNFKFISEFESALLELYDVGLLKEKLTKNTKESVRASFYSGFSPTNALFYGTPATVFDSGANEAKFFSLLETGFARRSLFAFGNKKHLISDSVDYEALADDLLEEAESETKPVCFEKASDLLVSLMDEKSAGKILNFEKASLIALLKYKDKNEKEVSDSQITTYDKIIAFEKLHRYFKVVKLAGLFSILNMHTRIESQDIEEAISYVEESAESLVNILNVEKPHEKVTKHILSVGSPISKSELMDKFNFIPKTKAGFEDFMNLCFGWASDNSIHLKETENSGLKWYTASQYTSTNGNSLILSIGECGGYPRKAPISPLVNKEYEFKDLKSVVVSSEDKMFEGQGRLDNPLGFFVTHKKRGGRKKEDIIKGTNLLVIDVDSGCSLSKAQMLLGKLKYLIYTTKSHTELKHRFRILIPLKYTVSLEVDAYKEFVKNFLDFCPIKCDPMSSSLSHRWETNPKCDIILENDEEDSVLLNPLMFIPGTKEEKFLKERKITLYSDLSNLEHWFIETAEENGRNNTLHNYGCVLFDAGEDITSCLNKINKLNKRLKNPLSQEELDNSVLKSIGGKYTT